MSAYLTTAPGALRSRVIDALAYGAAAWSAYAAIETLFTVVVKRLITPWLFAPPHPAFVLFLLVAFPIAGAILVGALSAIFRSVAPRSIAALTVAIAFAANGVLVMRGGSLVLLGICTLIVVVAAIARQGWLLAPWATALLVVVPVAIIRDVVNQRGFAIKAAATCITLFAIVAAAWFGRRNMLLLKPLPLFAISAAATLMGMAIPAPRPRHDPPSAQAARAGMPNVVIVVMDTVRADHTSLFGYGRKTTPFLESLAGRATLFPHAYAPGNMTLSSHASLFTGKYPSAHGAHFDENWEFGRPLSAASQTLAENLSARGYATAAVVANYPYLGTGFGLDRGFQFLDARLPNMPFGYPWPHFIRWVHYLRWPLALAVGSLMDIPRRLQSRTRSADEINASAFSWMDSSVRRGRPFFLFVNYMDAHAPCMPPPPYDRQFGAERFTYPVNIVRRLEDDMVAGKLRVTADERREIIDRYDASLAFLDHSIAALVGRLEALNAYDNTLLVITSDHGESIGEHGAMAHGWNVYQEEIHIPLLVKAPKERDGRIENTMASLTDIWKLVDGTWPSSSYVVSESFPMRGAESRDLFRHPGRTVIASDAKLILNLRGAAELYDLTSDPNESHNLAPGDRRAPQLAKLLQDWRAQTAAAAIGAHKKIDRETEDTLRSLGYVH